METISKTVLDEVAGSPSILIGMSLVTTSSELADGGDLEAAAGYAEAYAEQVAERGDVQLGAKTMYDALVSIVDVLNAAAASEKTTAAGASARAVEAARRGALFTTPLRAKRGRASYTEWKSVSHPGPGAVGTYVVL